MAVDINAEIMIMDPHCWGVRNQGSCARVYGEFHKSGKRTGICPRVFIQYPNLLLPVLIGIILKVVAVAPFTYRESALDPLVKNSPPFFMGVMYIQYFIPPMILLEDKYNRDLLFLHYGRFCIVNIPMRRSRLSGVA